MDILNDISMNLQKGKKREVLELVEKALSDGIDAKVILEEGLLDGMNIIGGKFKKNEVYIPEVLIAARAMNEGVELLKDELVDKDFEPKGRVVLCTVKGDLHDIGKNLVKMMMEGKGLEVIDLGVDINEKEIVEAIKKYNPDVLGLSALLTTTMGEQKVVIEELEKTGLRDKVKVIVVGAPITESFAKEIGADMYAADASTAAEVALSLVG